MTLASGTLDQIVQLLQPTQSPNLFGEGTSFEQVAQRRGRKLKASWRDAEREPGRFPATALNIELRLDAITTTVTTKWRFTHNDQLYEINGVDVDRNDRKVVLYGVGSENG